MYKRLLSFFRAAPMDRWADPGPLMRQATHAAALALVVAAAAEALFRSHSPLQAFVAVCSQAFIVLVILIAAFAWRRLRAPRAQYRIALVACLVLLILCLSDLVAGVDGRRQREIYGEALKVSQQRLETAVQATDWQQLPEIETQPQATGMYGEYERLVKTVIGRAVERHRDYGRELDELKLDESLSAARLAAPGGAEHANRQLRAASALALRHRDRGLQELEAGIAMPDALRLPRAERARLRDTLSAQAAFQRDAIQMSWQADARYFELGQAVAALVDRTQDRWHLDDQQALRFQDDFAQTLYRDWREQLAKLGEASQTQRAAALQRLASAQAWPQP
ncbi:hypothetical protein ACILG0_12920 [Pseudomonadota bacterium AL_CKDN230030165-1A_HGKHYDSX7]